MTKQEEIREGIAEQIFIWHIGEPFMWKQDIVWEGPPREEYYVAADMVMKALHSQGVVIKVDRELPKDKDCSGTRRAFDGTQERYAFDTAYFAAQQDMLKAGYVATEPLAEE